MKTKCMRCVQHSQKKMKTRPKQKLPNKNIKTNNYNKNYFLVNKNIENISKNNSKVLKMESYTLIPHYVTRL